jgi:hypothetical protein
MAPRPTLAGFGAFLLLGGRQLILFLHRDAHGASKSREASSVAMPRLFGDKAFEQKLLDIRQLNGDNQSMAL